MHASVSALSVAHDKFPLALLSKYKEQTKLISLTQIDEVQELQRLDLFHFNDIWLQEDNTIKEA